MQPDISGQLDPREAGDPRRPRHDQRGEAPSPGSHLALGRLRELPGQEVQLGEEVRTRGSRDHDPGDEAGEFKGASRWL